MNISLEIQKTPNVILVTTYDINSAVYNLLHRPRPVAIARALVEALASLRSAAEGDFLPPPPILLNLGLHYCRNCPDF